ncbi:MAG: DNA-processing protein DprA [Armatimonadota bacterium]
MDESAAWYALACAQLGSVAAIRLLEAFQQPEAIFAATPREWTARARVTASGCARLLDAANRDHAGELARLQRLGIRLIPYYDPGYPTRLRTIPDPPCVLFVKGELLPEDDRAIAIVGSRRASPYGRHVAAELAAGLAQRGLIVVSGMAIGTDTAAHEGCLRAGGRTIAVLGSGVDVIYPPENTTLYERIAAQGAVISENPPGAPPSRISFPIRNRIISGLSLGVIVVEASEKSGALITVDHALEQGREVFAVPGSVNSTQSRGTHHLLRDGARLVESVDDVLEDLPLPTFCKRDLPPLEGPRWTETDDAAAMPVIEQRPPAAKPRRSTPPIVKCTPALPETPSPSPVASIVLPEEEAVLRLLSTTATHVDAMIEKSGLSAAQVNAVLLTLELKGMIQRRPGNLYVRLR